MGENFSENLKQARLEKGMSQKDLAESICVAKSTYSLYESGKREPNIQTIKKISAVLGVSADELLGIVLAPSVPSFPFVESEYTREELKEIQDFAEFLKVKKSNQPVTPPIGKK